MNFGDLFAKTLSANQSEREAATQQLEQAANENFAVYLGCLSQELANEQQQPHLRTAAGLALKNALTARDATRRDQMHQQWLSLDPNAATQIKELLLQTLQSSDLKAATAASQGIAAIAAIELPRGRWTDVIARLLQNITNSQSTPNLKQSTLQAIGFTCEVVDPQHLESQSNQILTAVVQGARKEEPSNQVRLAALKALNNSLEFVQRNFEKDQERDFIMQVVCEATSAGDAQVVAAAFECLVKIMMLYYDFMQYYMQQALFALTTQGMRSDDEAICLQAIEFWSTVCDEEMDRAEIIAEAVEYGETPTETNYLFAQSALSEVVPVLLWLLTKQEEDQDEDDWNPAMAAGTCLSLFAQCVHQEIVPPVVPFVEQNIRNPDWRFREAAVMAFGSILEGPSGQILQPLVSQALPVIIELMRDPVVQVKDTAAWTLGRISDLHVDSIHAENFQPFITSLVQGLQDSPRVATNCAWSIMNLAQQMNGAEMQTYQLSAYFEGVASALLACAERQDSTESNLRTSAYEALSALLGSCAQDCIPVVQQIAVVMLDRLDATIAAEANLLGSDDKNVHAETQAALCGVVQSFSRRLGHDVAPLADRIMTAFLKIFHSSAKTASTVEDVFLAIGVMINVLEADFARYMDSFVSFLYAALQNHAEHQLCSIAVGLVGDLCRALGAQIINYCDPFMSALLNNLQSEVLHRDVKPHILAAFGDVALAISSNFEKYLNVVMLVLQQACSMKAAPNDYDMIDYVNSLREGILEAYTGIVQGFKADGKGDVLLPYVQPMFEFLRLLFMDDERSEAVTRGAVGLIGDLADALKGRIRELLAQDWVESFLKVARGKRGMSASTKEVAKWAKTAVKSVVG